MIAMGWILSAAGLFSEIATVTGLGMFESCLKNVHLPVWDEWGAWENIARCQNQRIHVPQ